MNLTDQQLLGVAAFLGAAITSLLFPWASARGVTLLKRRVYQKEGEGDRLIVFDLLLSGVTAQMTVVVIETVENLQRTRAAPPSFGPPATIDQSWAIFKGAVLDDPVWRGRAITLGGLIVLTAVAAEGLRWERQRGRLKDEWRVFRRNGVAMWSLAAVLLTNVFMEKIARVFSL